ncbi:exonuclease 1-like [Zingiber officinale]|uniref:exonuclease 1-like n=1 Tax=Zingiber officinale TaxID=94328 RepID=UPI001C4B1416|nr:exonuclease 1-like [Zingiber officinale]
MGIQNLLRFLKPFIRPVHIKKYAGKRVGIDAYSWLHKGAYSCSMQLCLDMSGDVANRYLSYFMHHINLLRHHQITPVVVFDGGKIPCKSATEHERQSRRKANLEMAKKKLKEGNAADAAEFFRKAIHVTPSMAYKLIQKLRSESIEFVVAPYEADAQLAYLSSREPDQGGIAAIITEDSDLIAYGCQAIVFKMDRYGYGEEIIMDRLFDTDSDELSFKDFDKELLTGMCVLAGCDFLPSIPGIGIKRAYSLVAKYKNLDRVLSVLKLEKRYKMPEHYCDSFRKAVAVFQHARVYDAVTRALTHLKPLDGEHLELLTGDLDLLGPELQRSVAAAIAEGKLNPITLQEFDYLPEVEACSGSASTPCFNSIPTDELKIPFEEDSCIMLLSQPADEEDIELITRVAQLDPMYIKEAVALSKLVAPKECQRVQEIELSETSLVPDNNPFKRRKMEKSGPEKINFFMPESQRSMQSNPVTPQAEKDKIQKKPKVKTEKKQSLRNEKNGILKFFQRLLQ